MKVQVKTIQLHHGTLTFSALTSGRGPLVLLLHGFPDNAQTWRHQLPMLARAGYQAVALTLRGYEPDSQPVDGNYSQSAIAGDVVAILDTLEIEQAHLVGHDWGAAVSYHAAALAPQRFMSLTTLSVPHPGRFLLGLAQHPRQLRLSWYMLFFQLRGVAEWVIQRNDYEFIRMLYHQWSPGWAVPEAVCAGVIATLRRPGVLNAALGYYRAALSPSALPVTRTALKASLFKVPVPTLAVVGEEDHCINADVFRELMRPDDFPSGLTLKTLANAGHFLHQEQATLFNNLLKNWLARNSA